MGARVVLFGELLAPPRKRADVARLQIAVATDAGQIVQDVHVRGALADTVAEWEAGAGLFVHGELVVETLDERDFFWVDAAHVAVAA